MTQQEVSRFLRLSDDEQFEDLRLLRTRAAHLSGGSLGAFTAFYLSIVLFTAPLINESMPGDVFWLPPALVSALFALTLGFLTVYGFLQEQHNMARATARLAFYEEALSKKQTVSTTRS